jgi:uncharacterized small protein (DUF1192 family)
MNKGMTDMIAYEIETMILEDISVDIHFDLCGVDRVAECIANRFAALEAENAKLKAELKLAQDKLSAQSWQMYPDRSGGQFTSEEFDNSSAWR